MIPSSRNYPQTRIYKKKTQKRKRQKKYIDEDEINDEQLLNINS